MNSVNNLLITFGIFLIILIVPTGKAAPPEQIHLATSGNTNEMIIQWGTQEDTTFSCPSGSNVEYGIDSGCLLYTSPSPRD